jgi:uncharacterized DUF497 family protein
MAFIWDEGNLAHIAAHKVRAAEVEELLDNDPLDLEVQMVNGEERIVQVGMTRAGRVLMVATTWRGDELRVVTAFPASPGFRQLYLREKNHGDVTRKTKDS